MELQFSLPGLCDVRGDLKPAVCLEVSPPVDKDGWTNLLELVRRTRRWTDCLAMADVGRSRGQAAIEAAVRLHHETGLPVVAHITCAKRVSDDFLHDADTLLKGGITHALVLRGDPDRETGVFTPSPCGFAYADEAIRFLRMRHVPLILGAACYPGGHPEDKGEVSRDITNMRRKVDAGASFLVSQAILDHLSFRDHVVAAARSGVGVPTLPCILALDDVARLEHIAKRCQLTIPDSLRSAFERVSPKGVLDQMVGIARATWVQGAPGLHVCTFNKIEPTVQLLRQLFEYGVARQRNP